MASGYNYCFRPDVGFGMEFGMGFGMGSDVAYTCTEVGYPWFGDGQYVVASVPVNTFAAMDPFFQQSTSDAYNQDWSTSWSTGWSDASTDDKWSDNWSDKWSDASTDDNLHCGMLINYLGWKDVSKNYGFIETQKPVMNQTRFIVFNIPSECKRYDKVEFRVLPNKKGRDKWKAVYIDKI